MKTLQQIFGYCLLGVIALALAYAYLAHMQMWQPGLWSVLALAASSAAIVMTVSVFWLWKEARVQKLERILGPIGHVLHCGYCFSLWIAAFYTGIFGINLTGDLAVPRFFLFLISWWALGFLNVLFFAALSTLWFKKVQNEFALRDLYKASASAEQE